MPYRRLPNTDTARIRAMKKALEAGKEISPLKLAFSAKNLVKLQKFQPLFEQSIHYHRQTVASQLKKNRNHNEIVRKARVYLTHFIRVMNMAVYRGELPPETRAFYGLAINDSCVPLLNTENELLSWGKRIIDGEEFRIRKGGTPITNPTIAVVKVRYAQFTEVLRNSSLTLRKNQEFSQKLQELRKEADEIILNIWNEVEAKFASLDEQDKREKCEEYGLVYFFRKNEAARSDLKEQQPPETELQPLFLNSGDPGLASAELIP